MESICCWKATLILHVIFTCHKTTTAIFVKCLRNKVLYLKKTPDECRQQFNNLKKLMAFWETQLFSMGGNERELKIALLRELCTAERPWRTICLKRHWDRNLFLYLSPFCSQHIFGFPRGLLAALPLVSPYSLIKLIHLEGNFEKQLLHCDWLPVTWKRRLDDWHQTTDSTLLAWEQLLSCHKTDLKNLAVGLIQGDHIKWGREHLYI